MTNILVEKKVKKKKQMSNLIYRGNFKGWVPYKVGPPCASCPGHCEDKLCSE